MATYLVTQEGAAEGTLPRMVEARTKPAAIAFVARSEFAAEPISTKEAVMWAQKGVVIEDSKEEA